MGGSVLAGLLIISIGEWGGGEALHCAAENCSVARISHSGEKPHSGEANCYGSQADNSWKSLQKLRDDLRTFLLAPGWWPWCKI